MNNKNKEKQKIFCAVLIIIAIIIVLYVVSPIAFARDGLLTREKVTEFKTQFDFAAARPHNSEIENIYMFYFGFQEVKLQEEVQYKGHDMEIHKICPFLYKWKRAKTSGGVYRISLGSRKYYFMFPGN